ncbi:MAG: glycosyltransferase [Gammaproteobacteria bacterium]|jgi:GT2 family glycosyltransferase/nucleoside-diphosphate-sugar epimerase
MNNRIGVIIVNYNSGQYLRRCLESLCLSDQQLSIVIVDNNSDDQSLRAIEGFNTGEHSLSIVPNDQNVGFSRGVNIGRNHLDDEYLMLLNPDCQVHPHTLRMLCKTFEENPGAGAVGALVFNEDGTEQRGCRRNEPTIVRSIITSLGLSDYFVGVDQTGKDMPAQAVAVDAVSGSAMMMRLKIFDQIGGMDESYFLHCEDLDVCRKVREAGYSVLFEPRVSVFHRQGGSSETSFQRVERLKHQGMMNYYRKFYDRDILYSRIIAPVLVWSHYAVSLFRHRITPKLPADLLDVPQTIPFSFDEAAVLVSGASTDLGQALLGKLTAAGNQVVAVSRSTAGRPQSGRLRWLNSDYFALAPLADHPKLDQWIHAAPIWTAREFAGAFARGAPERIIAVSSTSAAVKSDSGNKKDQQVVAELLTGEEWVAEYAESVGADYTILRPTMIYGGPRNKNINLVKRVIRLLGFFPMVGKGSGKRQPVHVDDVADACKKLLGKRSALERYNIAGREQMSYRDMVERVFASLGKNPRFVVVSRPLARTILGLLSKIPGLTMLTPEIADRMSADQDFPIDEAVRDFGFDPREFNP